MGAVLWRHQNCHLAAGACAMKTHEAINKKCPLKLASGSVGWHADCAVTDCMAWRKTGEDEGFCVLYQIAPAPAVAR